MKRGRYWGHPDDWPEDEWNDYVQGKGRKKAWQLFWKQNWRDVTFYGFWGVLNGLLAYFDFAGQDVSWLTWLNGVMAAFCLFIFFGIFVLDSPLRKPKHG